MGERENHDWVIPPTLPMLERNVAFRMKCICHCKALSQVTYALKLQNHSQLSAPLAFLFTMARNCQFSSIQKRLTQIHFLICALMHMTCRSLQQLNLCYWSYICTCGNGTHPALILSADKVSLRIENAKMVSTLL